MEITKNTYLQFIDFSSFSLWNVKNYFGDVLSFNFQKIKLKDVLSKADIEWVNIKNENEYPILGVRAQGQGVYINRIAKGSELTMRKYQKSKVNTLFYCKVRTVNGQWGIVYPEYEDSYGSSNMQYLDVDITKVSLNFLELLLTIKRLTNKWDENKVGADGRHFTLNTLLNLEIPLPSLAEQNRIVEAYNKKLQDSVQAETKAQSLEKEIESYLMEELGIEIDEKSEKKGGLKFVEFKELYRWDLLSLSNNVKAEKYPLYAFGEAFDFKTTSWNKKEHKSDTFDYVELGGVEELRGIIESTNLMLKDAPSRATQIIKEGDLIIGTTRPYLKRFAIVTQEYDNFVCSSGFCVIKKSENYNLHFLLEFLLSSYGVEQLKNNMSGALYPAITTDKLKNNIKIPLPPLEIQEKIVQHIGKLKDEIKSLKKLSEELRESAKVEFEKEIFNI